MQFRITRDDRERLRGDQFGREVQMHQMRPILQHAFESARGLERLNQIRQRRIKVLPV